MPITILILALALSLAPRAFAQGYIETLKVESLTLPSETASRVLTLDSNKKAVASSTTLTTLGYLDISSSLTTLLAAKAPLASPTFTGTITTPVTASRALVTNGSSQLAASATTATELGYVSGVTSAIQTQMDLKAPIASPTFTGVVSIPSGLVGTPSLAFTGDANTGLYRLSEDSLGFSAGGFVGIAISKSTGSFANAAMGGSVSVSDGIPLSIERSVASAGVYIAVSNTSTSANAYGGIRVIGDNGNSAGSFGAYTDASTVDAFDMRAVLRSDGSAKGVVVLAAGAAPNDIKMYAGGGTAADEVARFNDDNSFQVMQQIATPSGATLPASNTIKLYQKSDDRLYWMSDAAVEQPLNPMTAVGDMIVGTTGGAMSRVAIGTSNQVWTSNGTTAAWAAAGGASSAISVVSKTGNYTAVTGDDMILASGAAFTITLYAASGNSGKVIRVKKTDSPFANIITIDGNASETIDGATTTTLNTQYEEVTLVCDGTNWHILSRTYPQTWTAYTPTFTGFGTAASVAFFWRRAGDSVEIRGYFESGTPTAVEARISLPSGLTSADSTKIFTLEYAGPMSRTVATTTYFSNNVLIERSVTYLTMGQQSSTLYGLAKQLANTMVGAGNGISIPAAKVPISGWN